MNAHVERSEGSAVYPAPASPSQSTFSEGTIAAWESAIEESVLDGLLEQQGPTLRLTARGRLLSNEVFARFLVEESEETKVGTGHVNPR